jgi:dolichol-phosphate mannosyltransferase
MHLREYLRNNVFTPRILKFSVVGASGVFVNMGLLYVLTELASLHYLLSGIIAIETSIVTNFLLNNAWTWGDRRTDVFLYRLLKYHVSAGLTGILANWLLLLLLTEVFGMYYLISNIIGIGVGMTSNFLLNDLWTFRAKA